jgi:prepilin-type N-terminal cleavage/methylation domain-containing protein
MYTFINKIKKDKDENAFTIVELMVVVLVIGILSAILVPFFKSQQQQSLEASIRADLKNAAVVMHTESTRNSGKFLSYIPSYDTQSADNKISLDASRSSIYTFCLSGSNTKLPNVNYYYSSVKGKISTTPCSALTNGEVSNGASNGGDFQTSLAQNLSTKKALVTYKSEMNTADIGAAKATVQALGYGQVDVVNPGQFLVTDTSKYDLVYITYKFWGSESSIVDKAYAAYQGGAKVFMDGNDTVLTPFVTGGQNLVSESLYTPTYAQGLNPSFPYTFEESPWNGGDNWRCNSGLKNGAVAIANYTLPSDPSVKCATMIGATNGSGRFLYMSLAQAGPVQSAGLQWLVS